MKKTIYCNLINCNRRIIFLYDTGSLIESSFLGPGAIPEYRLVGICCIIRSDHLIVYSLKDNIFWGEQYNFRIYRHILAGIKYEVLDLMIEMYKLDTKESLSICIPGYTEQPCPPSCLYFIQHKLTGTCNNSYESKTN